MIPAWRTREGKYFTQRGVALLAAMLAGAFAGVVMHEFSTDTNIDENASYNSMDDMRAEFLARSAMNLSELVIRLQTKVFDQQQMRQMLGDFQITDYTSMFMGAFGGDGEEVRAIGEAVGGIDVDNIQGLGIDNGGFSLDIVTEDGKMNLNCANGNKTTQEVLATLLLDHIFDPAFDDIFQNADQTGWRRDRQLQVAAIIDYIDRDRSKYGATGNPEDYGYESLPDPYEAKNNYVDSIGELRLIRGVDERFWNAFGHDFTVYGDCKMNIGAMKSPSAIKSVIRLAAKDPNDPVIMDQNLLWALARRVIQAKALGVYFDDVQAFAEFVKNPDGELGALFGAGEGEEGGGAAGGGGGATAAAAMGLPPVQGVELDMTKLGQIVDDGPRRIYRVEATAHSGVLTKRITGVFDVNTVNQNNRNPDDTKGAWVYWREE